MTTIKYAIICEDKAHRRFLTMILPYFESENIKFEEVETHIKAQNKKEVDKYFVKACNVAFTDTRYKVDLFFICRDVDLDTEKEFLRLYTMFKDGLEELKEKNRNQTTVALPVRCIEHWLWYIKTHNENLGLTKNITLENRTGRDAKAAVYSTQTKSEEKLKILQELMETIDITKLVSRSNSFKKFHGDFSNALKLLPQT